MDRPLTAKRKNLAAGELKSKDFEEICLPYSPSEIEHAEAQLAGLTSAAPADLPPEDGDAPWQNVLRRSDLLDLFDTSSDISGNELDVSRFIRAGEDKDCYIAWRLWKDKEALNALPKVRDQELCPVPIGELASFMKTHDLFRWDFVDAEWVKADPKRLWPGMILLCPAEAGGYTEDEGWNPDSKRAVEVLGANDSSKEEGDSDDPLSWVTYRQTLSDHTRMVMEELRTALKSLDSLPLDEFYPDLEAAAAKHDWGKAHPVMQATLHKVDKPDFADPAFEFLAKQKRGDAARGHRRKHFRHELASALAMLSANNSDLAMYLVAAHHGRVRVSIRSMPGEQELDRKAVARGIRSGEKLPPCEPAPGLRVPEVQLSLEVMSMGLSEGEARAWTDRVIRLRDRLGPFRLAYLEMLLRHADETASAKKGREVAACAG